MPDSFSIGDHWVFDRDSARWAFDYVDFHTQLVYSYAIQDVRLAQDKWESLAFEKIKMADRKATEIQKKEPQETLRFLTEFCLGHAQDVVDNWWNLGNNLLVKYNHFKIYDSQSRSSEKLLPSESWLKALVEYERLKPDEDQ
jgi:dipeptidase